MLFPMFWGKILLPPKWVSIPNHLCFILGMFSMMTMSAPLEVWTAITSCTTKRQVATATVTTVSRHVAFDKLWQMLMRNEERSLIVVPKTDPDFASRVLKEWLNEVIFVGMVLLRVMSSAIVDMRNNVG